MKSSGRKASFITLDGNDAVASVAFRLNELIAIYPITPSSSMAETCDEWAAAGKKNLWGDAPVAGQRSREAAAAVGAFALDAGSKDSALTTTLPPGAYTAPVSGANGATGVALVEVYGIP